MRLKSNEMYVNVLGKPTSMFFRSLSFLLLNNQVYTVEANRGIYIYIYIIFFFPRMASSLEVAILRNYFLYSSILSDFLPRVK